MCLPQAFQHSSQELVVQQEQGPQTCLVRRDNEWRIPRKSHHDFLFSVQLFKLKHVLLSF